jgi:hypothetical protein
MGYVDKRDRMASSYSISRWTWKWAKKLFFHLLDLAILNRYILLSLCGWKKISHRFFTRPSGENAGTGWTRMAARDLHGNHPLLLQTSVDWIQVSTRTGLVQPIQGIVMCAV